MTRILTLPDGDLDFVMNGQDIGVTWTRLTDGALDGATDYLVLLDVATQEETFFILD